MAQLEQWMPKPSDDDIMILVEPILNEGDKKHILITHDESIFYANDGKKTFWGPVKHQPLRKKGAGLSLHVSDFLTEIDGRLKFEQNEACVMMKPGVNRDGWWKTEDLVKYFFIYYFKNNNNLNLNYLIIRLLKKQFQFLKNCILVILVYLHSIMQHLMLHMRRML